MKSNATSKNDISTEIEWIILNIDLIKFED